MADIVTEARVSRSTFYELFRDKESCFLAAFDAILSTFLTDLIRACEQPELSWAERVRAGLEVMLNFLAAEPAFAHMCMVDMIFAGPRARERYTAAVRVLITYVERGRAESAHGERLPNSLAAAIVGGGAVVIRDEILDGRTERLGELLPDLLYLTLAPYLGQAEAMRAIQRPPALRVA